MTELPDNEHFAKNYVDGTWAFSREGYELDVQTPTEGLKIAEVSRSSRKDVDHAVQVAREKGRAWSGVDQDERGATLTAALGRLKGEREVLAGVLALDSGLPPDAAMAETDRFFRDAEAAIQAAPTRAAHPVARPPVVAQVLAATDMPRGLAAMFGHLAEGSSVLLKPSEQCPLAAVPVVEALRALPPGAVALLQGTGSDVEPRLAGHPDIDAIVASGSRRTAAMVLRAASQNLKRVSLTALGVGAAVVLPGANLDDVARDIAAAVRDRRVWPFATGSAVHVESALLSGLTDRLEAAFAALDPADPSVALQPLFTEADRNRFVETHAALVADGAEPVVGGAVDGRPRGYFAAPALFSTAGSAAALGRLDFAAPLVVLQGYAGAPPAPVIGPSDGTPITVWAETGRELL